MIGPEFFSFLMQEANIFENRPPKDLKVALRTILGTLHAPPSSIGGENI